MGENFIDTHTMVPFSDLANAIRFLSIDAIEAAKSGHPGMPMGIADVATVLFKNHLVFNPQDPNWSNRDRFVLSAGHGSMLLYSLLYLTGYAEATLDELKKFRQLGSKTPGHPEHGHLPGVEMTTGPLGQGFATAVGMALAERMLNAKYSDSINHYTYVLASDGDLMEGINHEAASLAGHLSLHKLIVLYDDNNISIDGKTDLSFSDDTLKRFEAYGWSVKRINGHDYQAIDEGLGWAKNNIKPTLIACRTKIGFGAPNKENTHGVHGSPLGASEVAATRKVLNWPHAAFDIPKAILQAWRAIGKQHEETYQQWCDNTPLSIKNSLECKITNPFIEEIKNYKQKVFVEKPNLATRVLSQQVLELVEKKIPLVGGSADLTPSNNTKVSSQKEITKHNFSGSYIHYGVREHAMAAIMNGISLSGVFIPYGGTFLVFLDYLKPALRLSALMRQGVIYILTHDSIGLGEDGPTHQPVEQLAHLRCVPNLLTFRPMDAIEVAECWELALEYRETPSALILTRQNLPFLSKARSDINVNLCSKGAYYLREEKDPKVVLMATGSEVHIAQRVAENLQIKNISVSVISVPCMELFEKQSQEYKSLLLNQHALYVAIEAAHEGVWRRYLGKNGIFIGLNTFGASAPANDLYKHFQITADVVLHKIQETLEIINNS